MNFDPVASYYDRLARLIFGKSIINAQIVHFKKITNNSKILIVGGGSGWIIDFLPADCRSITYIEPSQNMLSLARSKGAGKRIEFVNKKIEETALGFDYDVIITNFFFDQFDNLKGNVIARRLANSLKGEGLWIQTDFMKNGIWWQSLMLGLMYFFFRITVGLTNNRLPDWESFFRLTGMELVDRKYFFTNFIASICYQKQNLSV